MFIIFQNAVVKTSCQKPLRRALFKDKVGFIIPYFKKNVEGFISEKEIKVLDEEPIFSEKTLRLAQNLSEIFLSNLYDVLSLFSPPLSTRPRVSLGSKNSYPFRKLGLQDFFEYMKKRKVISLKTAKRILGSKVKRLIEFGLLKISVGEEFEEKKIGEFEFEERDFELTEEQKKAGEFLKGEGDIFYIFGVTGSGKTEVYIEIINHFLKMGKTALYLLPEISISNYQFERLKKRFIYPSCIFHSDMSEKERTRNWWLMRLGIARVCIGTRSAVFAPLENLGVIVIDEEHDKSFKQRIDANIRFPYDARIVALERAKIENSKIVFGSATPSLEIYSLAKEKGKVFEMKERVRGLKLPQTIIVDLKKEKTLDFVSFPFSLELKKRLEDVIERKEQAIILFNRRGSGIFLICKTCSRKIDCSFCSSYLRYHKNFLECSWCGRRYSIPSKCECGSGEFEVFGFGTEYIEEEIRKIFDIEVFRIDSDLRPREIKENLKKFSEIRPSILVGTQMVAKGFDFPFVTFVGVVLPDIDLAYPDFRSNERTFQLLVQVVGRSGRWKEGISLIQTYSPNHPVINFAVNQDYKSFFDYEISLRKELGYPPFKIFTLVKIEGDEDKVWDVAKFYEREMRGYVNFFGPAKSLRYKVDDSYNVNIFIFDNLDKVRKFFPRCVMWKGNVRILVDVFATEI